LLKPKKALRVAQRIEVQRRPLSVYAEALR